MAYSVCGIPTGCNFLPGVSGYPTVIPWAVLSHPFGMRLDGRQRRLTTQTRMKSWILDRIQILCSPTGLDNFHSYARLMAIHYVASLQDAIIDHSACFSRGGAAGCVVASLRDADYRGVVHPMISSWAVLLYPFGMHQFVVPVQGMKSIGYS